MAHKTDLEKWNDAMYLAHPTPYQNKIAGIVERARLGLFAKLTDIKPKDTVLEIGCEQGVLLAALPSCKQKVGVDISEVALKDAARRLGKKAKFLKADAEKKIALPDHSFDCIVCSQMLEHVAHPELVLANIKRLAKPEARIVISVPNEVFMLGMKRFLKRLGLIQWLFPGIEEEVSEWHLQVFTDSKMRKLVEANFEIIEAKRAYNIYLVYLLRLK